MMRITYHILFEGPALYMPVVCPRAVLWKRVPQEERNPLFALWVNSADNASTIANVTVVEDGTITGYLEQKGMKL
jgi:hypothetical protein